MEKAQDDTKKLVQFVKNTRAAQPNGKSFPRIVLFSPIAHEDLKNPNLPDGKENTVRLEAYTQATEAAAKVAGVAFVDLFHPSLELYKTSKNPITINGIHLNEEGNRHIAAVVFKALFGKDAPAADSLAGLRDAVLDKSLHWHHRFYATDENDVWGSRSTLSFVNGQNNAEVLQHEMTMLDVMTANRDERCLAHFA